MNLFDSIVILFILFGAWRGFCLGAVKTILSLIAWICAWFLGFKFASVLALLFRGIADSHLGQLALAFCAISVFVLMVGHVIVWFLLKILAFFKLTIVDKSLGAILGASKNLFKILIFLTIFSPIFNKFNLWQQSYIAEKLLFFTPVAKEILIDAVNESKL